MVVYGVSGAGKTYLLAHAVDMAKVFQQKIVCIREHVKKDLHSTPPPLLAKNTLEKKNA